MRFTVLGSGTVVPYPLRGNSGYFLRSRGHNVLVDGGAGALRKMADFGLDYRDIDTVTYTHFHPDHTMDLIPLLFALKHDPEVKRPRELRIVGPPGFQSFFDRVMEVYGVWVRSDHIAVNITEVFRETVSLEGLEIISSHTEHTPESVVYRFREQGGGDLFYSGDTDVCDELIESARNVDVLVLECSLPDDRKLPGHLTPSDCGRIAAETGCGRLVLTHFYPQVLKTDIVASVSRTYAGPVELAYDGMEVEI
ncbi:MAG: MBL fold metallo-hydrolase [Fidelibacterota bacterium]